MDEIYRKNEFETNEFVSKAIKLIWIFILIIGLLCWFGIFNINNLLINGFILASLLLLIVPMIFVDLLHVDKNWIKYFLIVCVVLVTGIAYIVFTFQTVIIFIIPSILASFYLDKKIMRFTAVISIATIFISHFITGFYLFQPWIEPFSGLKFIMLYGALPRMLQYSCCMILLSLLCNRYSKFLSSFYSVIKEENKFEANTIENKVDKNLLKSITKLLTERENDVFELMVKGYTNAQIANQLCISNGTVKNYVSVIYDKVGERDRTALVLKYSPYYRRYD